MVLGSLGLPRFLNFYHLIIFLGASNADSSYLHDICYYFLHPPGGSLLLMLHEEDPFIFHDPRGRSTCDHLLIYDMSDAFVIVNTKIDRQSFFGKTRELILDMKFEKIGVAIGHRAYGVTDHHFKRMYILNI